MVEEMKEDKIKHLEMIQDVITRMNSNSFQIKSWSIMVLSALLALFASSANELFVFVAIFPMCIFWVIDALYLQQERKFVELSERVAKGDTSIAPFTMPMNLCKGKRCQFWNCFFSKTLIRFYGGCVGTMAVLFLLLYYNCITFEKIQI